MICVPGAHLSEWPPGIVYPRLASLVIPALPLLSSLPCLSCHLWFTSLVIPALSLLSSLVHLSCHPRLDRESHTIPCTAIVFPTRAFG